MINDLAWVASLSSPNAASLAIPLASARGKKALATCPQCGSKLIRAPGISICENPVCDSLPKIVPSASLLEAWAS